MTNSLNGKNITILTNKWKESTNTCNCTAFHVRSVISSIHLQGKNFFLFFFSDIESRFFIELKLNIPEVDACILPVLSANMNFVTVAINHSRWVPNVAYLNTVQSLVYTLITQEIVYFIYVIKNQMSFKHY